MNGRTTPRWFRRCRSRLTMAVGAVLTGALLLTACGGGGGAGSSGQITLTEEDWYPTTTPQGAGLQWLYDEYARTHPGVTIKRTIVPGSTDLIPKLLSQAQTNSMPDIAIVDNPFLPAIAATGKLQDIEGDLHGGSDAYLPGQKSIATGPSGQLNGVFMGVVTLSIFYNKKMFKEAGITSTPKTWAEMAEVSKKLTNDKVSGFVFGGGQDQCATWQFNAWQWTAGGTDVPLDSPGNVQALDYWKSLVDSGSVPKTVVNACQDDTYQQFAKGQVAMMENGPWDIAPLDEKGMDYGIFSIPTPEADQKVRVPLGGEMFTLPVTGDKDREAAAHDFLKWSQRPEILAEFNRRIGYIPAQSALWPDVKEQNPKMASFVDALPEARGRTDEVGAKYPQWSQAMSTAMGQVLLGQKPAAAALQDAQKAFDGS